MKRIVHLLLASLAFISATLFADTPTSGKNCGCECCKGKESCCCVAEPDPAAPADAPKRHPLKGLIVDILADRSALLVKHEEIPGYMKAMTMLLKVDAATLRAAAKGRAITGTLVEKDDGFWLEDVQPVK